MEILNVVAKAISAYDNHSYMYEPNESQDGCSSCGIRWSQSINLKFKLKRKNYDISYTYDGYCIVSSKFKEFCTMQDYNGLDFQPLPNNSTFFWFTCDNLVNLDIIRRKVVQKNYCNKCQRFYDVAGSTPAFLQKEYNISKKTIYKSDVEFGHGSFRSTIFIVNLEVFQDLKNEKFRGLYFHEIFE